MEVPSFNKEVTMRWIAMPLAFALALSGCAPGEPAEEEAAADTAAASMAQAVEAFDPSVFDTITWESDEAVLARGEVVYRFSCLRCHGERGLGDAGFVRGGDTLRPPSFREPDWAFAGDKAGIREQIFVGTLEGMPHWGLAGLGAKDIDAVATYVVTGFGGK
jgi:mono/diheme cytochrome c family protein